MPTFVPPFEVSGDLYLNSEWFGYMKVNRLLDHLPDDVYCVQGNYLHYRAISVKYGENIGDFELTWHASWDDLETTLLVMITKMVPSPGSGDLVTSHNFNALIKRSLP